MTISLFKPTDHRVKVLSLDAHLVAECVLGTIVEHEFIKIKKVEGLPKDAQIVSMFVDPPDRSIRFLVWSSEFKEVAQGEQVPGFWGHLTEQTVGTGGDDTETDRLRALLEKSGARRREMEEELSKLKVLFEESEDSRAFFKGEVDRLKDLLAGQEEDRAKLWAALEKVLHDLQIPARPKTN